MRLFGLPHEPVQCAWTRHPIDDANRVAAATLFAPLEQPPIAGVAIHRSANPRLAFALHAERCAHLLPTSSEVITGAGCEIHPSAVLGHEGFGYEWHVDEQRWVRFPHVGRVIVFDDVHIGAHTCIDRGALGDTVIHSGARIDNLVHIAHNAQIGSHAAIVAQALICGSVTVGPRAWIGGGAIVREGLTIGADAVIGLGAVVTKDVPAGETWAGVPARPRST